MNIKRMLDAHIQRNYLLPEDVFGISVKQTCLISLKLILNQNDFLKEAGYHEGGLEAFQELIECVQHHYDKLNVTDEEFESIITHKHYWYHRETFLGKSYFENSYSDISNWNELTDFYFRSAIEKTIYAIYHLKDYTYKAHKLLLDGISELMMHESLRSSQDYHRWTNYFSIIGTYNGNLSDIRSLIQYQCLHSEDNFIPPKGLFQHEL